MTFLLGDYVSIDVNDDRYKELGAWLVIAVDESRLVVEREIDGQDVLIKVQKSKCTTMALAIPTFDTLVDGNAPKPYPTKSIDVFISGRIAELLEKWYPLPGEPGNSLFARTKDPADTRPLYMFPKLDELNLELFFHSRMFGQTIKLEFCDVLGKCPAGHIWIYCCWCQKFVWGSHRESKKHQKGLTYYSNMPKDYMRQNVFGPEFVEVWEGMAALQS